MGLSEHQEKQCREHSWDFSGLSALFLNCTLKPSPQVSHTQGLIDISKEIMKQFGAAVDQKYHLHDLEPAASRPDAS